IGQVPKLLRLPENFEVSLLKFTGPKTDLGLESFGKRAESLLAFTQCLLDPLAFCHISRHFGCPNDTPLGILHRRNSEGNIDRLTVFSYSNSIEMLDPFAPP